ncbi:MULTISPECIES: hypothetical protein [unclassified Haloarcula]|nr:MULTISPECIES: hypothetical protein [unclassified Haloarcula]
MNVYILHDIPLNAIEQPRESIDCYAGPENGADSIKSDETN